MLTLVNFCSIGQIVILLNGHILNKNSSHLVTLVGAYIPSPVRGHQTPTSCLSE